MINFEKSYHVYAMFCRDGDGPTYVKFGFSGDIGSRLSSVRTSCPIPARWFATVNCLSEKNARKLEKALHKRFADRKVTGEWFKFDISSEEDKREFNDGSRAEMLRILRAKHRCAWDKVSVTALDEYNKSRREAYLKSKHRGKIDAKARGLRATKKAWKEIGEYGYKSA